MAQLVCAVITTIVGEIDRHHVEGLLAYTLSFVSGSLFGLGNYYYKTLHS